MGSTLGKCGFDCGRCPAFQADSKSDEERKRGAATWERYFGLHFKPDVLACDGCQEERPWRNGNLLPDRSCPIRACAVYNGVPTCAQCASFPCEEYSRRVPGPGLRREREDAAGIKFSDDEWRQHLEPYDGQTHLTALHATIARNLLVTPKEFSAGPQAPFPATTTLGKRSEQEMKDLHSLLSHIFSHTGLTYAEHVLIERQRPYIAGLLWVMGLFGRLEDGQLVLDSADHPDRKECQRLIRKSDNTPHKATQQAISALAEFGVRIESQRHKKGWTITMRCDGPSEGLVRAVKEYSSALAQTHGAPAYVDGYNLRGEAFKAFLKADMDVFQR